MAPRHRPMQREMSNYLKLLYLRDMVVSVEEKAQEFKMRQVRDREMSVSEPSDDVSIAFSKCCQNQRSCYLLGKVRELSVYCSGGNRHLGGMNLS